tara:strand:+ start:6042 stop:6590 length:549 start_codon:yes stop_codon:yes gene_type:complete
MIHSEVKINLGCGDKKLPGFINVDSRPDVNPDAICVLPTISTEFKEGYADLIYASHVLEHFERNDVTVLLAECYKVLKPGGKLRLAVPDFDAVVDYYILTGNLAPLQTLLYGGHKYPEDYHFIAFSFRSLQKALKDAGFNIVERYDWKTTEHAYIDDYSQAYLPHMEKIRGKLMSLNVEATK